MRSIISVSNKSGIADFARGLQELGIEIFSTGGTKRAMEEAGLIIHSISDLTGFPEILDGRVKTLHPAVHGGILARRDLSQHLMELTHNNLVLIDMVVVNLYPFMETIRKEGVLQAEALENIDIGGPSMLRSAAKNFPSVLVIVNPEDYAPVLQKLREGDIDLKERRRLAQKAFQHVAIYDTAIAEYLREGEAILPGEMTVALKKTSALRYGENPHQKAAFYIKQDIKQRRDNLSTLEHLNGPQISFNNLLDFDAAVNILSNFNTSTVAIFKHTNSCGLASHNNLAEAYRRALSGDPIAAFGGVVASNRIIDLETAEEINRHHYDAIVAPGYKTEALELLGRKKSLRLASLPCLGEASMSDETILDFRCITGGFLVQTTDFISREERSPHTVTNRQPTEQELSDLIFAWIAVKCIKSNAIVIAKDKTLLGMGAGQPSRVVSVELALKRAGSEARGSVMASDAFFPFPDGPELAFNSGVTAVIQPGGSKKDNEVIAVANKYDVAMVFTGVRHFRH
jgi:phosphoribosylaminoimidazolecarboxamide formyltransferase / IMP cyclohydrolase